MYLCISCYMMLEMKRLVVLLSVVLLTFSAPIHQSNEMNISHGSQIKSQVTQFRSNTGSDIIITAPAGFGKPDVNGQSTVTVSLRDENTNISIDVVSFVFSAHPDEGHGGSSNTNHNQEEPKDGSDPTEELEVAHSQEELNRSEEQTSNPGEGKSGKDQICSTGSDTGVDSKGDDPDCPDLFQTPSNSNPSSFQEESNESDSGSEHQKTKVHNDQSQSTESSGLHHHPGQLPGLRSAAASLIHEESTSAEANEDVNGPRADISFVGQNTFPDPESKFQEVSLLSPSSEEKTADEAKNKVINPPSSRNTGLHSGSQSMINIEVEKENKGPPTPFFFGSDFYPEYVNDDWRYDPRYYDHYRNQPEYGAGYDPYGTGYDPYHAGYDPYGTEYDPYHAGYDPYGAGYDPYHAGYDPYNAGYDPYGAGYDPYQTGYYTHNQYHKAESEEPSQNMEQEPTPAYSVEENKSHPTETSHDQDNSFSEEQPQSPSISPLSSTVSLTEGSEHMDLLSIVSSEEPTNSSSTDASREIGTWPSKDQNDLNSPTVFHSEQGTKTKADAEGKNMVLTGSSSSEENVETTDSEQEIQNQINHPGDQVTPDPVSVVQVGQNIQDVPNQELQRQSVVDLIPAVSSEEDDPLINTIRHIMTPSFNGPESTASYNTRSENNQHEELSLNESATDSLGISAEVTAHIRTKSLTFDSIISNKDASNENGTPDRNVNLHGTTRSTGGLDNSANANSNNSEESQEVQIFNASAKFPTTRRISHAQHTENSNVEENTRDRKFNGGVISPFPVQTPAKIPVIDLWTSFLRALNIPISNESRNAVQKNIRGPQSVRRYHQGSSEERK